MKGRKIKMIVPVRCFSCGAPVAQQYEEYLKKVREGKTPKDAMNELKITRYCCRRTLYAHVGLLEEINKFKA